MNHGLTRILTVGGMITALAALPFVARATHFADLRPCSNGGIGTVGSTLNAVELAINSAAFLGRNATSDQSNLLSKLQFAYSKATQQKWGDAMQKLQDISDTATALAGAAKPKLDDATGINNAVTVATACMTGL
ncbi:MAG: hypothetical protein ACM3PU_07880 [Gemmatimonadota bacterium]